MKVTFRPTIAPRQIQYGDRTRTRGAVGMAVEFAVQKNISRLDIYAAPKAGLDKGAGENNACITVKVQMTRRCVATRKYFKAVSPGLIFELRPHVLILAN
jgi:hypothetical protein